MKKNLNRIVFWGTYDTGKPRVRLLLSGAKTTGIEVLECHADIWKGVEDKSQLSGLWSKLRLIISLIISYPILIYKYLRLPEHDIVIVGYMGNIDVLIIWLFARLRKVQVCWDVFLSIYDTIVEDRKIVSKKSIAAKLLYTLEWLGARSANLLFMDTKAHAAYFEKLYDLPRNSVKHVFVGAEKEIFKRKINPKEPNQKFTVLFYGQFIPLHGIDTIVKAAQITESKNYDIQWIIIGKGQEGPRIDTLIKTMEIKSIQRISWVPYEELVCYINNADICLGIFNGSGKATRVIPNKVYQILCAGKPLITGDTPAIRELIEEGPRIVLVPPENPEALSSAVINFRDSMSSPVFNEPSKTPQQIGPVEIKNQLLDILSSDFFLPVP